MEVSPRTAARWREFQFRKQIPISNADYRREPASNVRWFVHLVEVEARVSEELAKRHRESME